MDANALQGTWIHSHEEGEAGEMVYRPPSYAFPPARGRTSIRLNPDGTFVEGAPGPVDRPVEAARGRWSVVDDDLVLDTGRVLRVCTAEPDRLVVKDVT